MSSRHLNPPRSHRSRKGLATLIVILSLMLVMSMIVVMLRQIQSSHRHRRQLEHRIQATLLAESAIERAVSQAMTNGNYTSESWEIPAEEFDSRYAGNVTIEVNRSNTPALISVAASYPSEGERRAQVRREVAVDLP